MPLNSLIGVCVWCVIRNGGTGYSCPGLLHVDTLVVSGSVMMVRVTRPQPRPLSSGAEHSAHTRARAHTSSSQLLPGLMHHPPPLIRARNKLYFHQMKYFLNVLLKICQDE